MLDTSVYIYATIVSVISVACCLLMLPNNQRNILDAPERFPNILAVCTILTNFSVILPGSFFLLFQLYISSVALVYNFFYLC